ncbi:OsmC family protein [Paenibacillus sp. MBLB4367]|uniref:OsmC family protein n=1 Tax=Paenibacillus sp. MBLB4367 TaxID=3384767 RepID=UPI003907E9BA
MTTQKKTLQVTAEWLGGKRFEAKGPSGYPVRMDSDVQNGGEGSGNSPLELVVMGLVGCMGIGVVKLLEKMRQPLDGLDVKAEAIRSDDLPHAVTEIRLTFHVKGEVSLSRLWHAIQLEQEQYCPVAASLKAVIVPLVTLNGGEVQSSGQLASGDEIR